MNWPDVLRKELKAPLLEKVDLRERTTMYIAGSARYFTEPEETADIAAILRIRKETGFNLYVIGGGSNLIVGGGVIPGLFVSTRKLAGISDIYENEGDIFLDVESGTEVAEVLSKTFSLSAVGLEHLTGIPGTIGGAIAGNAGTTGISMSDNICSIDTVEPDGSFRRWEKEEIEWDYRFCSLNSALRVITGCRIKLHKGEKDYIRKKYREYWAKRKKQPYSCKSAGCIFKNPAGNSAGKLLDESGCKGLRYGGAMVSDIHANFIVNIDNAKFSDIKMLIGECKRRVRENTGIDLELEVRLIDV